MDVRNIEFQRFLDERGNLVVAENPQQIPFPVKRIYYIYGVTDGKSRGLHSHKQLQQIYIAIHGSCKVKLTDGKETQIVSLDKPYCGLYLGHNVWREIFDFSDDAVLLVLASEIYKESDYIRSYDEFLKSVE